MAQAELPFVVLGMTVAGVAAALELASHGVPIRMFTEDGGIWIHDCYEIPPTPINHRPVKGNEFEELAFKALKEHGVMIDTRISVEEPVVDTEHRWLVIPGFHDEEEVRSRGVVFAAHGQRPEPPADLDCEGLFGRGVGWSAASDLYMSRGQPTLVLGSGYYAVEQALIASEAASAVTILTSAPDYPNPRRLRAIAEMAGIHARRGVQFRRLMVREDRVVIGLVIESEGREEILNSGWIFLADEPLAPWGGETGAWWQLGEEWIVRAGASANVAYWDYAAQWQSGVQAARKLLTRNGIG